jgi:transketolase
MDAVQKANSGHPGMPMGMADIAEVLWSEFLKHNPSHPDWLNRDRFILSNGHGSMLQYSLLHLTGYNLSLDDLKNFRQWGSKTPGHPEHLLTDGIETTTGPLGQGLANAVGMAIAQKILAAQFNQDGFNIIDHDIYVFCGDGCLMEGLSHEVCSLAGTLKLDRLICFYDDNQISIDGDVRGWFTDNTPERFKAYHWHVIPNVDGHDAEAIKKAIIEAKAADKPTLICCKTHIGFGAPTKMDKASSHGSPLGAEEIAGARKNLNWPYAPFEIPTEYYAAWNAKIKGAKAETKWLELMDNYRLKHPELYGELMRRIEGKLPNDWNEINEDLIRQCIEKPANLATRKASQKVLEVLSAHLPEMLGGSADLTESNNTNWSGSRSLSCTNADANYIHYGVREFGMSAIMNGIAIYKGFIPHGATFLVFYSYAASAVRMAALNKSRVIFVYTHDSIGLGEDGPTHQPIEQLAALRATPNTSVWRPCDMLEAAIAWRMAIENQKGPTAICLTRQTLPALSHTAPHIDDIQKGGYVIYDCNDNPDGIIIATGSEVHLAVEAAKQFAEQGKQIRVVSMPSIDTFLKQTAAYQKTVLPAKTSARIAIEAGATVDWYQLVGTRGKVIGLNRFGESAPAEILFEKFGFTAEHVVNEMLTLMGDK